MFDKNGQMAKYYIAASYPRFRQYVKLGGIHASDAQFIKAGDTSRIMGLKLTPENVEIIDDPSAPWSFWQYLMVITLK